uniref:Uncharacterized protein n=1 Tax=Gallus gallus TaxID=9031 RepID=A0A8V0XS56_CHICK
MLLPLSSARLILASSAVSPGDPPCTPRTGRAKTNRNRTAAPPPPRPSADRVFITSTLLPAFPDGFPTATERFRYRCAHCSMPLFLSFPPRSLREVFAKKSAPPAPLCPQPDPSLPLSPHTMGAVPHLHDAKEEKERLSPSPPREATTREGDEERQSQRGSGCSELRQNRRRVLCVALCAVPCILVSALVAVIGECPPHPHGDAQPPSHLLGCPRGAPKHLLLQLPASATAPRASPRGRASQPHLSCRGTSFASHLPNSLPVSAPASVVLTSPTLLPRVPQHLGRFPREMLLFLGHGERLEQQQGALPPPRSFPGHHRDSGGDGESGA